MSIVLTTIKGPERADVRKGGTLRAVFFTLTFAGNYAAGGEVITAPNLKTILKRIGAGELDIVVIPNRVGYSFEYDYSTDKVIVCQGDNDNAADAPGVELPAAGYPAALTGLAAPNLVRGYVFGR